MVSFIHPLMLSMPPLCFSGQLINHQRGTSYKCLTHRLPACPSPVTGHFQWLPPLSETSSLGKFLSCKTFEHSMGHEKLFCFGQPLGSVANWGIYFNHFRLACQVDVLIGFLNHFMFYLYCTYWYYWNYTYIICICIIFIFTEF